MNVFCVREMMDVIDKSFLSKAIVCSTDVIWFNWKKMLSLFFTVPFALKLSTYHVFRSIFVFKGGVKVQLFSSDQEWNQF